MILSASHASTMAEVTCLRRPPLFCLLLWHPASGGVGVGNLVVHEQSRRIGAGCERERERDTLACILANACQFLRADNKVLEAMALQCKSCAVLMYNLQLEGECHN
jgi:hypothetical protein